jgi:muconate cycloisomerase
VATLTITGMTVRTLRLPVRSARSQGVGTVADGVTNVFVELTTDAGITGWGEAAPWAVFTGTAEAALGALHVHFRPFVVGADAFRIEEIMGRARRAVVHSPEAKAALEMALYDIVGKAVGAPVHVLLGGKLRDTVPLSISIANPDFEKDLAALPALLADGLRLFKVKTGFSTHAKDLTRLERLREVMPDDVDLRVDFNQGLECWDALPKLRDVEAFAPTFIEQPVPADKMEVMADLAAALDTPLMADESVFDPTDALRAVGLRAADLFSVKIHKSGGMVPARAIATIAEAAGIACYGGSMFETGLSCMAGAQMIAATRNISLGCEFYQPTYYLAEDVLADPFPVANGEIVIPDGPGLGVEIDPERIAKYETGRWE